jgi:addiction module RelE/StbE family toxin
MAQGNALGSRSPKTSSPEAGQKFQFCGGSFLPVRDGHIEPDWLLIYTLAENGGHVRFERTGTHADLFH